MLVFIFRNVLPHFLLSSSIFLGIFANLLQAETPCVENSYEEIVRSESATAALFSNWLKRDGSVSKVLEEMFAEGQKKMQSRAAPANACSTSCSPARTPPALLFESVPQTFLANYEEASICEQLFVKTKSKPLQYQRLFENFEDLTDWITLLSRGKGKEGEDLYTQCVGSCSPQYFYTVTLEQHKYLAKAKIICGHARDKDDDMYTLRYGFRWSCAAT
jgi:hypothetical protein